MRDDSSQSSRAVYMSISRDASLSFSRDTAYRAFGDPALAYSPRRPFEDFSRDPPSIGSRPATPYADILKEVLRTVHMPDLMVRGLPPPSSPWELLPDDPQDNQSVALALDDHIIQELLKAFKAPEPRTKLVKQNSPVPYSTGVIPEVLQGTSTGRTSTGHQQRQRIRSCCHGHRPLQGRRGLIRSFHGHIPYELACFSTGTIFL